MRGSMLHDDLNENGLLRLLVRLGRCWSWKMTYIQWVNIMPWLVHSPIPDRNLIRGLLQIEWVIFVILRAIPVFDGDAIADW